MHTCTDVSSYCWTSGTVLGFILLYMTLQVPELRVGNAQESNGGRSVFAGAPRKLQAKSGVCTESKRIARVQSSVCCNLGVHIYTYIHPSIHPSMQACMHACMHAIHTCMQYIHTYICTYMRTYIHIYLYTNLYFT